MDPPSALLSRPKWTSNTNIWTEIESSGHESYFIEEMQSMANQYNDNF